MSWLATAGQNGMQPVHTHGEGNIRYESAEASASDLQVGGVAGLYLGSLQIGQDGVTPVCERTMATHPHAVNAAARVPILGYDGIWVDASEVAGLLDSADAVQGSIGCLEARTLEWQ